MFKVINGKNNMYIIIMITGRFINDIKYLGWQKPAWDESGYFWTEFHTISEVMHLNTEDHPFIFQSIDDAYNHAEKINLHHYEVKEIDMDTLKNLAPSNPHEYNRYCKPGIAIEVMNKLIS